MTPAIRELEDQIRRLKVIEAKAQIQCATCDGQGHFLDTTYDRTGAETQCQKCFGTGLPADRVRQIINDAFAPYRRSGKP
jgi:DnaJ-class molecular chaperone